MNRYLILILTFVLFLAGCIGGPRKEFLTDKVPEPPKLENHQEQANAVKYIAYKAEEIWTNALELEATNIARPALELRLLTTALAHSLPVPTLKTNTQVTQLVRDLEKKDIRYERAMAGFKAEVGANAGKSIEGTGLFSISYFTYWGVIIVGLIVGYVLIKLALNIWAPMVSVGLNSAGRMTGSVLSKAFSQVVAGGEKFKEDLDKVTENKELQTKIKDAYRAAQMAEQDKQIQDVVRSLTK